jgi:trans-aconitate methyltransferase
MVEEHGRRYLDPTKYPLPNDEREQERLDLLHLQWLESYGGLVLCPKKRFHRVLDIGAGTGTWAIEFADTHPEAHVIGVDISPALPESVPPNCEFQVDDLELRWMWRQPFDLIHARMLGACFKNPGSVFKEAFRYVICATFNWAPTDIVC